MDDRLIENELAVPVEGACAAVTPPSAISRWWGNHVLLAPFVQWELREHLDALCVLSASR